MLYAAITVLIELCRIEMRAGGKSMELENVLIELCRIEMVTDESKRIIAAGFNRTL